MSKLDKSLKNARVAFLFYFVALIVAFFSRKVFIDTLGTELVGLSATIQNILGFLNLAELGIYSAVSYSLYKPLVDDKKEEINRIVSLFGYLYRLVGIFILVIGIIVSFFLPLIFAKSQLNLLFLYGAYYTFLSVTLFSYFNNFRQILLNADQKGYIVSKVTNYSMLLKVILQVILLKYLNGHYIGWLVIEFVFGLLTRWWINHRVKKEYPWLRISLKDGKQLIKEYSLIIKNVKNLFVHKIAEFVGGQTDNILIFVFSSLSTVTLYTNYTMITKRIITLVVSTLSSNMAGIGHVIAEGDTQKNIAVFKEFNGLFFLVGGVMVYCLYYLIPPFISIWLGENFIITEIVFLLIIINTYIALIRQSVMYFINGYCLYYDIWAPITEAIIKLVLSVLLGYLYGLAGVLIGTCVSTLVIVCIWKPYFLFSRGFKLSVWYYWKDIAIYVLLYALSIIILLPVNKLLFGISSYFDFFLKGSIIFIAFFVVYGTLMYFFDYGIKQFTHRLINKFLKKR